PRLSQDTHRTSCCRPHRLYPLDIRSQLLKSLIRGFFGFAKLIATFGMSLSIMYLRMFQSPWDLRTWAPRKSQVACDRCDRGDVSPGQSPAVDVFRCS